MMTDEKVKQAIHACADAAQTALESAHANGCADALMLERLGHVVGMRKACAFVDEGGRDRREKAMRWLGFAQGVLWAYGVRDLEALKRMNMSDGAP